ncbi:MAG: tetratricopeptide repeat protein [Phycisphaerales bacterium]|nr:tetratricopeptide repeat protein [Phycisphaerales bacterium]
MTPERWHEVDRVVRSALACPPATRDALLNRECGNDAEMRREVESLLAASSAAGDFLEAPAVILDRGLTEFSDGTIPGNIGNYRVIRRLGAGGMGIVYLAEQSNPRRRVALKVIRAGIASTHGRTRFAREAEVLGRLKHPGIAQIYEAGHTTNDEENRAFIAMEYVEGETLRDYVNRAHPTVAERLELFAVICDSVQHAHQKGVIHRDLKPSNILVVVEGGKGTRGRGAEGEEEAVSHSAPQPLGPSSPSSAQPKILDFGIARITDDDSAAVTLSDQQHVIGTLLYMSPEQLGDDRHEVDTRADVYALGIVGYELLCGMLPYDIRGKSSPEIIRRIIDAAPAPLGRIDSKLAGDLETIFAKALEKDPQRRYPSAAALGEDVRRFLNRQPITARPPTVLYQLHKFAQRNRGVFAGVTFAIVGLLAGSGFAAWQAFEATRGRTRAEHAERLADQRRIESDRMASVADAAVMFLTDDLLASAAPGEFGRDVTILQAVDAASERIDTRFVGEPETEAAVRLALGRTYYKLGLLGKAESHLDRALELFRASAPDETIIQVEVRSWLARVYNGQGRLDECAALRIRNLDEAHAALGPRDPFTIAQMVNLAHSHQRLGQLDQAERLYEEVLEIERAEPVRPPEEQLTTQGNLAALYVQRGQLEKALPLMAETAELSSELRGPEHPSTLIWRSNLALVYSRNKQYDLAEPLLKDILAVRRRVLGEEHAGTLITLNNLAKLYQRMESFDRALALFLELLELGERVQGVEHPQTLNTLNNLGMLFLSQGDAVTAGQHLARAAAGARAALPTESLDRAMIASNYGTCLLSQQRFAEAESWLLEARLILKALVGEDHPRARKNTERLNELYATWPDRPSEGQGDVPQKDIQEQSLAVP